jgi:hypothetical protein
VRTTSRCTRQHHALDEVIRPTGGLLDHCMESPDVPASEHDGRRDDGDDASDATVIPTPHRQHLRVESLERLLSAVDVHRYADVQGR